MDEKMNLIEEGRNVSASYHTTIRSDILHLCSERSGRILDVGGGSGETGAFVKKNMGGSYLALIDRAEVSPAESVDFFASGAIEDPAIWENLDTKQDTFDTILCLDILEHLVDPWEVVKKCSERLAPGGSLIISLPNARNRKLTFPLFFKGRFELQNSGVMDRTHLRWFVKDTAKELATFGGLELTQFEGGWYMNRARRWERLAKLGIAPGFLYQIYYMKAMRRE